MPWLLVIWQSICYTGREVKHKGIEDSSLFSAPLMTSSITENSNPSQLEKLWKPVGYKVFIRRHRRHRKLSFCFSILAWWPGETNVDMNRELTDPRTDFGLKSFQQIKTRSRQDSQSSSLLHRIEYVGITRTFNTFICLSAYNLSLIKQCIFLTLSWRPHPLP